MIDSEMPAIDPSLTYLFGGEGKTRLLQTLFARPEEVFHLRGLATAAGVDSGNASKALKGLVQAHLVKVVPDSRGVRYQADDRSPLFEPLRQLFLAASELLRDLKEVAEKLPAEQVLIFGSVAQGTDRPESDIDILVVGDLSAIEAQAAFNSVGRKHRRHVDVLVASRVTISKQLEDGSLFWRDILGHRSILLKGEPLDAFFRGTAIA